jgi:hypothetical protein
MSEFKADIEAIEAWGQATSKAILKGLPAPELSLPSCHERFGHQEQRSLVIAQTQDDSQAIRA